MLIFPKIALISPQFSPDLACFSPISPIFPHFQRNCPSHQLPAASNHAPPYIGMAGYSPSLVTMQTGVTHANSAQPAHIVLIMYDAMRFIMYGAIRCEFALSLLNMYGVALDVMNDAIRGVIAVRLGSIKWSSASRYAMHMKPTPPHPTDQGGGGHPNARHRVYSIPLSNFVKFQIAK